MSLDYNRSKRRVESGETHWTSYSDLFLVLSVVFLLMFAVANLRTGIVAVSQSTQVADARKELESLRQQIKVYEAQRDDYLKKGASAQEEQVYKDLVSQLHLLEGNAKAERDDAMAKAKAADEKHKALNHYQQLVKNVITANLVASSRLQKRNAIIEEQGQELEQLSANVEDKEAQIAQNRATIAKIESDLSREKKELERAFRAKKLSREKYQATIAKLEADNAAKLEAVRADNQKVVAQLGETRAQLEEKNRQSERLLADLAEQERKYNDEMATLARDHEAKVAREKAAFEARLRGQRMSAEARLAEEKRQAEALAAANRAVQERLAGMGKELEAKRNSIKAAEAKYQADMDALNRANSSLQKNLQASLEKLGEQQRLAEQIKKNFKGAGVNASVDAKTGDVLIDFENEYFDTGSASLKPGMRDVLQKTIPVYAKSLFQDPKIVKRIQSVEIIGFASPTFKGKAVDPASLSSENRAAVNYNMDLSYQRAKGIFEHVFDTQRMSFEHQKELLGLVKVSGRSYFATEKLPGRSAASADGDYCKQYDCRKAQRVIIKFNLKEE